MPVPEAFHAWSERTVSEAEHRVETPDRDDKLPQCGALGSGHVDPHGLVRLIIEDLAP